MSGSPNEVEICLRDGLACLGMAPGQDVLDSLVCFLGLLRKWNRAINLTGLTDVNDMAIKHILDSATARPFLRGTAILDVGSGAGLPGIPLSLLEPLRQFCLLDSNGKKIGFVRQAITELGLRNVAVHHGRVEDFEPETLFDTVICRALTSLPDFVRDCGRLAAPGGRLVAMKGRWPRDEVAALPGPWRTEVTPVEVPGLAADRHMVVMER